MKGIVWGLDFQTACNELTEIIGHYVRHYGEEVIDRVVQTKHSYYVKFTNNDFWEALTVAEYNKGKKCNISYIDHRINDIDKFYMILACTKASPFQAYKEY
jgi:hypothetical protein